MEMLLKVISEVFDPIQKRFARLAPQTFAIEIFRLIS